MKSIIIIIKIRSLLYSQEFKIMVTGPRSKKLYKSRNSKERFKKSPKSS